jgi:hypothetical protein
VGALMAWLIKKQDQKFQRGLFDLPIGLCGGLLHIRLGTVQAHGARVACSALLVATCLYGANISMDKQRKLAVLMSWLDVHVHLRR